MNLLAKNKELIHLTVKELQDILKDCIPEANIFHSTFKEECSGLYKIRGVENNGNYITLYSKHNG